MVFGSAEMAPGLQQPVDATSMSWRVILQELWGRKATNAVTVMLTHQKGFLINIQANHFLYTVTTTTTIVIIIVIIMMIISSVSGENGLDYKEKT